MSLSRLGKLIQSGSRINTNMKPFTVVVEGNIGSGKSTFLQHFQKYENVCVLSEPIEKWRDCRGHNLLGLQYEDIKKWAFSCQMYVLLTMMQHHTMQTKCTVKLMERSIFSARHCFVEKMRTEELIAAPSAAVLDECFDHFIQNTDINVDLIVYLRTSPEIVYERMLKRKRPEEKAIPFDYLKDMHDRHEKWLYNKTVGVRPAPVIIVDGNLDQVDILQEYIKYEPRILNKLSLKG